MKSNLLALTAAAVLGSGIVLTGCGGSSSSSNNSGSDEPQLSEVNATEANATADNGVEGISLVLDAPGSEEIINTIISLLDVSGCENNGTAEIDGVLAVDGGVSATFSGCLLDGETFDGSVAMMMSETLVGGVPTTHVAVSFPTLFSVTDVNDSTFALEAGSNLSVDFAEVNTTITGTQSGSVQWSVDGTSGRYDDLTVEFMMDESGATQCYTGGTLYIADLSESLDINQSFDANCDHAFTFDENGTLTSGSMQLVAADGAIDVNVTSDNNISVTGSDGTLSVGVASDDTSIIATDTTLTLLLGLLQLL